MNTITIINLFLLPCLITILVTGAALNYKSVENNKYQKTLMTTFIFWAVIMVYIYIKFFLDMQAENMVTISFVSDVCSTQVLLMGATCFISLISYPVVILDAKFLTLNSWKKIFTPIIIPVFIFFIVHLIAGINPFIKYSSQGELWANISSVSVISRLVLVGIFSYFWSRSLWRIWHIVPYYNRYIQDNYADSNCNVGWIRKLVLYIAAVMCAYFALLFYSSPLVNLVYLTFLVIMFGYMVGMSLIHHTSVGRESIKILRDPNNPDDYIFIPLSEQVENPGPTPIEARQNILKQVDEWMNKEFPYSNINFTTNDILDSFPQLTRYELTQMFRSRSLTFQSYVRRFRIKRACEILSKKEENIYTKKIFVTVGFSHYSSFSRAFVTILGISPSEFAKLSNEDKNKMIEKLREN